MRRQGPPKKKCTRQKTPKTCTREDYAYKIDTEKERYIVKRDRGIPEIEFVSSNSLPHNEKLRVDKLNRTKKSIQSRYISKQNMTMILAFSNEHISKVLQFWDNVLRS
ncbi:hypothetical protein AVEN_145697-1 [Araneus ventricosus]|uniref:Uncharacterized protein n=1 Tax=Araneus ventricosus TaxID=182803 RepID=A0A4Y2C133_ARAVE|nr:hypothetical protein AVEN_145697-1 [Araneus ventricosus]